jgi:SAM-dependent methyltransferase
MGKRSEIEYVKNVVRVENVDADVFTTYLQKKPFSDRAVARYLMDMSQILSFLPPPPAKVLDLGVGSGWTSEIFAWCGYEVTGLDISPDLIAIAQAKLAPDLKLAFATYDYEDELPFAGVDAVVMYDSLHHAENETLVIKRAHAALRQEGVFVCIEPGTGHSATQDTQAAVRNYGVTEKDMPFMCVSRLLRDAGFRRVEQYLRASQLPLVDLTTPDGSARQLDVARGLLHNTCVAGLTSTIVARR